MVPIENLIQSVSSLSSSSLSSSSSSSFSSPSTYSDVFYLLIVVVECYCCTWLHSMTHTLSRTSLDEGSAGRRDKFVFVAVLLKMWRHRTFRILVHLGKLQCYLSQYLWPIFFFFLGGATARSGPCPPLQYASRPLDPLLCLSIRLSPSFSRPWTRHPAISFLVFLFVLLHTLVTDLVPKN